MFIYRKETECKQWFNILDKDNRKRKLTIVVHSCNPRTQEVETGEQPRLYGKLQASQGYTIRHCLKKQASSNSEKSTNFRQRELSITRMLGQITYLGKLFPSFFHHIPYKFHVN